jgi:hypothetical protein
VKKDASLSFWPPCCPYRLLVGLWVYGCNPGGGVYTFLPRTEAALTRPFGCEEVLGPCSKNCMYNNPISQLNRSGQA